jgi:hypothetical protein
MGTIIEIRFHEDLSEGQPKDLGRLLNRLRYSMEMAQWKARNRALREDPNATDYDYHRMDMDYERVGLP